MFGIDLEDEYCIVVFEPFPGSDELAGKHIHCDTLAKFNGQLDPFLRGHFRWTLCCQFVGGDIRSDYTEPGIDIMEDAQMNGVDLGEPFWQTRLGKEILVVFENPVYGVKFKETASPLHSRVYIPGETIESDIDSDDSSTISDDEGLEL
ncbi:hypothetical protein M413DRAFT_449279 [Hebeloma cylindrosporum]|uniref:Uncharacterized protein n=1 Tax=Hebeloma cylindrosporum TaxID=76867 RepID=A0A0C2XE92_HEBCY|nr:hypothetical protein M413DRAFT_449279 [Hebeloma cylindrosporum h7]